MERYSYLQTMPNSPLTPLTPLSENTKFKFNFAGDGSLDEYIDNVLQEHRVEQQRKKLLQQANQSFQKKLHPPLPRRYSEEFIKIRNVFEDHKHHSKERNCSQHNKVVKIYTETTPLTTRSKNHLGVDTPTKVRTPLKLKNNNVARCLSTKIMNRRQQQKMQGQQIMRQEKRKRLQTKKNQVFIQVSPVAAKPLCSQVANILQQCGLTMYNGIFQREEIDLLAFRLLGLHDLHNLGIIDQNHCAILMKRIHDF